MAKTSQKATKSLVIVESPAKARTVGRFLGEEYEVRASLGHVRDLPKSQLGVDIANDFTPKYLVPRDKLKVVKALRTAAQSAVAVYLATDPDREGEAISWHLVQAINLENKPTHRVVFHEITQEAIREAFRHPREIELHLVDAQQARRILDRLVGYQISPLLWQKVKRGLSAGRVQSAALRMVVEREREIQDFIPAEYWTIEAELKKDAESQSEGPSFRATFVGLFNGEKMAIRTQSETDALCAALEEATYIVSGVQRKDVLRQPAPPFTTSTLQQEAFRQLYFSVQRTMSVAQQLYEGLPLGNKGSVGLITYMRTDSTHVATSALDETRAYIRDEFGTSFLPHKPRLFRTKTPNTQEAHEAIRPTSIRRTPEAVKTYLNAAQQRLYELIWKRMVASQMAAAVLDTTTLDVKATTHDQNHLFRASSSVVKFPGFRVLYLEGKDEGDDEGQGKPLPELAAGEPLMLLGLFPEQHFTQPLPRFTEATLVKALEQNGIGRPSTYATILSTIQERGYVHRANRHLAPLELGFIVNDLLTKHFPDIVDLKFTARMEEQLDAIAQGKLPWVPVLRRFYDPFQQTMARATAQMERVALPVEYTKEVCEDCGKPMVIKAGRYGRFLACSGFPACRHRRSLLTKIGVPCPRCGGELVERRGRGRRPFFGCANYPNCDFTSTARPLPQPCPQCGQLLVKEGRSQARCLQCAFRGRVMDLEREPTGVA